MKRRREKGQSLVEMALLFPILLLILAAVIDTARAFDAYINLTNAVREGARYGSKHPYDTPEIKNRVVGEANGTGTNITRISLTPDDVTVSVDAGGQFIRVTAECDFHLFFGGIVGLPTIRLHKSIDMPIMVGPHG